MPGDSTTSTAVVVGATGIVGRAIAIDLRDPDEARRGLAPDQAIEVTEGADADRVLPRPRPTNPKTRR